MSVSNNDLYASLHKPLGRTQLTPAASAPSFSSKAPPLPKALAQDLLNKNKNKLIRAAITASRADPALANAQEIAFTEALSKADARRTSHSK